MLRYFTSILLTLGPWALFSQKDRLGQDSLMITEYAGAKSGFAWGGTPVLAYDSDTGLRYGAVINLFDYGKGSRYPDYLQYARIRLYNSTKGTSECPSIYAQESASLQGFPKWLSILNKPPIPCFQDRQIAVPVTSW